MPQREHCYLGQCEGGESCLCDCEQCAVATAGPDELEPDEELLDLRDDDEDN